MNSKHILVPLDVLHSKTDTLLYLQLLAAESPISTTLLYVVDLNIEQPDQTIYAALCAEGESVLRKLARRFLGREEAARIRVRTGRPDAQILAEARSSQPDLILMSSPKPRSWRRFFRSRTVERVVQFAPCPTLVLPLSWPVVSGTSQPQPCRQAASPSSTPRLRPTWAGA
jgi:nucleotide-binding universal stress UspA family protein